MNEYTSVLKTAVLERAAFRYVEDYAAKNGLKNTQKALALICSMPEEPEELAKAGGKMSLFAHCVAVSRMLIDLHIQLTQRENDIMLASALCHELPETGPYDSLETFLTEKYSLDREVYDTVVFLQQEENAARAVRESFFEQVKEKPLALLIILADRGNIIEQLYDHSSWSARRYIYETRKYYFPLCIYAKEHYIQLQAPVSILMEKMRSIIEIVEILLTRYEERENQLMQEILILEEENAIIKSTIEMLKNG